MVAQTMNFQVTFRILFPLRQSDYRAFTHPADKLHIETGGASW